MNKSLLFDSPTRNVFLNVLNVLKRISDKDFIENSWGDNPTDYGIFIISCQEALAILGNYSLFDLLLSNRGICKDLTEYLPNSFIDKFTQLLIKIDVFQGYEKRAKLLLRN
ncbi:MAG: hypothetical protein U5N85_18730 [Arcicella sp.]|nr:hypothetical protein [Arcicella sp.]